MNILGLNAFHGDASAAVLRDGQLVAALEEERLNRIKHWAGLPVLAAKACLQGVQPDHIAISRNPRAHLTDKLFRAALRPHQWLNLTSRASNSMRIAQIGEVLAEEGIVPLESRRVHFVEHHRAHLASAFFASPFEEAAVVSIDGFGDFSSVMWGVGKGNQIEVRDSVSFPHSLGIFYTAFTQFLGFPKYGDEYKMMGLSAYGEPRFAQQVRRVVHTEGGQCRLNLDYFTHHTKGVEMTWYAGEPKLGEVFSQRMVEEFGNPRAASVGDPTKGHGPGGFGATGAGGELFRAVEFCPETDRRGRSVPGRRSGFELRRQWHDLRTHEFQRRIHPASGPRRGDCDWCGAICATSRVGAAAVF